MILLTEYHASFIRLWRVILLRSDIRFTPSDIRFASFWGEYNNTVSLICKANLRTIPLRAKRVISLRSNTTKGNRSRLALIKKGGSICKELSRPIYILDALWYNYFG